MNTLRLLTFSAAMACCATAAQAADIDALLKKILAVGPRGEGNAAASAAWQELSKADAKELPKILAALDDANPLAANWIRGAVDAIAEREVQESGKLPVEDLEKFLSQTKHDARARRLAYEWIARVDPTAPDRIIPGMLHDPSVEMRRDAVARVLEQAQEKQASGDKTAAQELYRKALSGARDEDQVKQVAKALTDLGEKVDLPKHFGFIMHWQLIAPFDNRDYKGFDAVYPPEQEIKLEAVYEGKEGEKARWKHHETADDYGLVDLNKALGKHKGAVAYAYAEFTSDKKQHVEFRLGSPTAWKLWVNGELIFGRSEYHRGTRLDQYIQQATLRPGRNQILLKICQNEQTERWAQRWQFQLRVCDSTGTAILSTTRPETPRPAAGN